MTEKEICLKAIEKYGIEAQTLMVFEEMSELQKELCKHARGADNINNIAEEIADVQIMLAQMILFYGIEKPVESFKHQKLNRLRFRLLAKGIGKDGGTAPEEP